MFLVRRSCEDGGVAEWTIAAGCKLAAFGLRRFESSPRHQAMNMARWEWILGCAHVAQLVEHVLGKNGVTGSSPVVGSIGKRNAK